VNPLVILLGCQRGKESIVEGVFSVILGIMCGLVIYWAIRFVCNLPGKSGYTLSDHFDNVMESVMYKFGEWCVKHLPW